MAGCNLGECGCGKPGRPYMGMCVHEHLMHDTPVEVCPEHARGEWYCVPCVIVDDHECLIELVLYGSG